MRLKATLRLTLQAGCWGEGLGAVEEAAGAPSLIHTLPGHQVYKFQPQWLPAVTGKPTRTGVCCLRCCMSSAQHSARHIAGAQAFSFILKNIYLFGCNGLQPVNS